MRLLVFVSFLACQPVFAAELVISYPEREKEPYIAEAPSSKGIYLDLLKTAAARLGLDVRVERMPKKRMLADMQAGLVDLYPGSFSLDRIPVMNWMENGLHTREVCLAKPGIREFNGPENAPQARVVAELGSSKETIDKQFAQLKPIVLGARIDISQAARLLREDRADIFFIERDPLSWYLKQQGIKSLRDIGLQLLGECGEPEYAQLFGFARQSRHYRELPNPRYRKDKPLDLDNLPSMIDPASTAGKLALELKRMQESGETDRIARRYLPDYRSWPVNIPAANLLPKDRAAASNR